MSDFPVQQADTAFRRFLDPRQIETLSVADGLTAFVEFYRVERADDARLEDDGDMLLFQFGPAVGDNAGVEINITRQFILPEDIEPDTPMWQLGLTWLCAQTAGAARAENEWCHHPDDAPEFLQRMLAHPVVATAETGAARDATLDLGPV